MNQAKGVGAIYTYLDRGESNALSVEGVRRHVYENHWRQRGEINENGREPEEKMARSAMRDTCRGGNR